VVLFCPVPWSGNAWYVVLALITFAGVFWRIGLYQTTPNRKDLPYPVAVIYSNGTTLYLVGTLHISPRCPTDVELTMESSQSEVVMIELDAERLDKRRRGGNPTSSSFHTDQLQEVQVLGLSEDTARESQSLGSLLSAPAVWNRRWSGSQLRGRLVEDVSNPAGLRPWGPTLLQGALVLIDSGDRQQVSMARRAWHAAAGGAAGVVVVSDNEDLPLRVTHERLCARVATALAFRTCSDPPIPLLVVSRQAGEELRAAIRNAQRGSPVELTVLIREDTYPARSLGWELCFGCVLMGSGVGLMYGLIELAGVEVGAEFVAAQDKAEVMDIPCICMDVSMDGLCGRLGRQLRPTPSNIYNAARMWITLPRLLCQLVFPRAWQVDLLGSAVLHVAAFKLRTCLAYILAVALASLVSSTLIVWMLHGVGDTARAAHVVHADDQDSFEEWISITVQLFAMPQLLQAILLERDEAMYQALVKQSRIGKSATGQYRMTAVCGAAHANGILGKVVSRGL